MSKKLTKEEIDRRILESGVDAHTDDVYINAKTPMEFYCSKGHRWKTQLGNVTHNHQGCPYCSGLYPIVGETDLWTVYPEIARLLKNPSDGYRLTKGSGKKVEFICPNCGSSSVHAVNNIVKRGFSCPVCSDGISYPNKFIASMFEQLEIKYKPEYKFSNSKYKYDFYLPNYNIIVEMHGRQHYEEWGKSKRTLKEEQENDRLKMDFAIKQGVSNYIIIDARSSDINYIYKHIIQSQLNNIFDLSNVNWRLCGYYANGSLVHKSAGLYNSGCSIVDISNELKYNVTTIRNWLKKATNIGLCEYVPSKGFLKESRSIILLNTKEIFNSISEAGRKYNVVFQNISKNCKKERKYAGIHPQTRDPLVWRFLDEYDSNEIIDFKSLINPHVKYPTIQN